METSTRLMEKNLSQLTFSAEDSPVNQSPLQENVVEHLMKDGFGESLHESFARLNQDGLWLKTSRGCYQQTLEGHLQKFSGTWPRAGMMQSGMCFQQEDRVALVRHTKEQESLSSLNWPTPIVGDAHLSSTKEVARKRIKEGRATLSRAVQSQMWPTPRARDYKDGQSIPPSRVKNPELATLGQSVKIIEQAKKNNWPTPTAHNAKETAAPSEHQRNTPTLAAQAGGTLNPTWVEWLMGFPIRWTDLKHLETQLSPKSQDKSEK